MRVRLSLLSVALAGFLGLLLVSGFAQEKKKTYAKGDSVQVKYVGEVVTGKVVSAKISGFIEVEFLWKGTKMSKTFPLTLVVDSVAPVTPAALPATPSQPATGTPQPASGSKRPSPAKPATKPATPKPAGGAESELRTWASDTGKFTIEARFGGLEDGQVKLLKPDGSTVSIPLEKLSQADRELATQLASSAESPFMESPDSAGEDPFQESPDPARPAAPKLAAKPKGGAAPLKSRVPERLDSSTPVITTPVDWSGVSQFDRFDTANTPPVPFQLKPDVAVEPRLEVLNRPYLFATSKSNFPTKKPSGDGKVPNLGFFEKPRTLMMDPLSNQAIVTLHDGPPGTPPIHRVIRIDLKDSNLTTEVFPSPVQVSAYDPPTRRFMAMSTFHLHPPDDQVKVFGMWKQGETGFEPLGAWDPHPQDKAVRFDLTDVQFAGKDYAVITTWPGDRHTVWNVTRGMPEYEIQTNSQQVPPAVSASGKYLGVIGNDGYARILDLPNGEQLGKLPCRDAVAIAFDSSGRYVAVAAQMRVLVYDLQEGRVHREIFLNQPLQIGLTGKCLMWLNEGYLLAGAGFLIDLERSRILWKYELPWGTDAPAPGIFCDGRYWYMQWSRQSEQWGILGVQIPHPEALDAAKKIDPDDWILKPGAKIQLVLNTSATPEEQVRIKESLSKHIESQGMLVDDTSPLVLTGTTSIGQPAQQTYKFENAPDQTVTSTPQIASVTLMLGGEVLWKQESVIGGAIPFVISLQKGQSAQDYINALAKPNFDFFHHLEIPARLAKSPPGGAYGFSSLTERGIEKASPPASM